MLEFILQTAIIMSLTIIISYILSYPISLFIDGKIKSKVFEKIENKIFNFLNIDKNYSMNWKEYFISLLLLNIIFIVFDTIFLSYQGFLSFIGPKYKGLSIDLSFNTAISFVTNTNLQHYIGELNLSITSQILVITSSMFIGPSTGLSAFYAFTRGFLRKSKYIGNFYVDFIRSFLFLILPISIVTSIIFISLGLPQTFNPYYITNTHQIIYTGPVASLESIKLLGNNGGGYYGSNSANLFENPSNLSNYFEMLLMLVFPLSMPLAFGRLLGKKRGFSILASMIIGMAIIIVLSVISPPKGIISVRFGNYSSLLFNSVSLSTNTGALSSSLYSMSSMAITGFLLAMFIQSIPGSIGTGFMYMIVYVILTLFILGLMVGKMPEIMGMKINPKDIKLSIGVFLTHPILILIPTAIALSFSFLHLKINAYTYTQILYEFTSSAANNGSDYLSIIANTQFYNYSTAIVMFLGRYLPIGLMLALSNSFSTKDRKAEIEPIPTEGLLFILILLFMIFLLTVLTFFPFIIIGPFSW